MEAGALEPQPDLLEHYLHQAGRNPRIAVTRAAGKHRAMTSIRYDVN